MDASVIYGYNPVVEALLAGVKIDAVYVAVGLRAASRQEIERVARECGVRVLKADRKELDRLARGGVHQGVVAVSQAPGYCSLEDLAAEVKSPRTVLVLLDEVQDPHNLGAIARSALAFGAGGLIIPARRSVGVTPVAMKASAGALSRLPVARVINLGTALDQLKEAGFWACGAVVDGGQSPWEFDPGGKVALVMGSEGSGVRQGIESRLDFRVRIPMRPEAESLNVSVATALLLYEWLARVKSQ